MAYPDSMEVPLISCSDGQSRKRGIARSLAIAAGGVVAMLVGGFLVMDPFYRSGADSVPSRSAESSLVAVAGSPVCKPYWCKRHGYEEDVCNCGICGSYGGCSWTCDPTHDEALHRLRACTSSAWYEYDEVVASFRDPITWFGAVILASGFLAIMFSVIKCKSYFRYTSTNKMTDDEYLAAESIGSDSTSARSDGVLDDSFIKVADFGDSSSEQSSKDRDVADADILEQQAACHNIYLSVLECQASDLTSHTTSKAQSLLDKDSVVDGAGGDHNVVESVAYHAHCQDEPKLPELLGHRNIKDLLISPQEVATTDNCVESTRAVLLKAFRQDMVFFD